MTVVNVDDGVKWVLTPDGYGEVKAAPVSLEGKRDKINLIKTLFLQAENRHEST